VTRRLAPLLLSTGLVAAALLSACSSKPELLHPYDRAPVPAVPDRTHEVAAAWVDSQVGLADGQYWAGGVRVDGDRLVFTIEQAFFGPACTTALGADECMSDYGVLEEPSGELAVDPTGLTVVSVVADDQRNFSVPAAELVRLAGGGAPSAGAPADYRWVDFPFLLTVRNGAATEARQIWVP
jgi:hypothetical protein